MFASTPPFVKAARTWEHGRCLKKRLVTVAFASMILWPQHVFQCDVSSPNANFTLVMELYLKSQLPTLSRPNSVYSSFFAFLLHVLCNSRAIPHISFA